MATVQLTIARFCPPVWSLRQQLISSHVLLTSTNNIPQPSHLFWMIYLRHSSLFHYIIKWLELSSGLLNRVAEHLSVATNTRTSAPFVPFVFRLLPGHLDMRSWSRWWKEELLLSAAFKLETVAAIKGGQQAWVGGGRNQRISAVCRLSRGARAAH